MLLLRVSSWCTRRGSNSQQWRRRPWFYPVRLRMQILNENHYTIKQRKMLYIFVIFGKKIWKYAFHIFFGKINGIVRSWTACCFRLPISINRRCAPLPNNTVLRRQAKKIPRESVSSANAISVGFYKPIFPQCRGRYDRSKGNAWANTADWCTIRSQWRAPPIYRDRQAETARRPTAPAKVGLKNKSGLCSCLWLLIIGGRRFHARSRSNVPLQYSPRPIFWRIL